jgi:uncharacterized protein YhaN
MRIERIELDGFGHFAGVRWDLSSGMTVMLGDNEAGKTTLLNAIRALLFGFESTREGRTWYPALAGGRRGGRLVLVTEQGERWTVERHGDRGGQGQVVVRAPSGNQGGAETLDELLGHADRELFNNIFAFGLGELESFDSLSSEGVSSRIYGAGSGLGGVSALDLEKKLRGDQESAYKVRGRDQRLNALLARIEELRARIAELERQPAEHEAAVAELAELRARYAALRTSRLAAVEHAERLRRLLEAQPKAAELAELERSLASGDPRADGVPPEVATTLDARLEAIARSREALAAADVEIADRRRELDQLQVDEALLEAAAELVALRDERQIQEQRSEQLREAEAAAARHAAELSEQLRRVGGWHEERLLNIDDSIAALEATRQAEQRLTSSRAAAERLEVRIEAARADLAAAERDNDQETLDAGELERRRSALSSIAEVDRRLAGLDERQRLLAELGGLAGGSAARWLPFAAGIALAAVVVALGVTAGMPAGMVVVAGLLVGAAAWAVANRLTAQAMVPSAAPATDRGALMAERARLLDLAALPANADAAAVAGATTDVAVAIVARRDADARRARLVERRDALERLEAEHSAAARSRAAAEDAWHRWLADRSLPVDASPEAARQLLAAVQIGRRAAEQRDEQLRRAAAIREAADAFDRRLLALLQRLARPAPTDGQAPSTTVIGLSNELERATVAQRRRAELTAALEQLQRRRESMAAAAAHAEDGLASLLEQHRAGDADELRSLVAAAMQRSGIRQRVREQRAALVAIAGSDDALPGLLTQARDADPATLTAELDEATAEAERLDEQVAEALTRDGALMSRIEQLEAAEELGQARQ